MRARPVGLHPQLPGGAPFSPVHLITNELMRKTGMSLRRRQPQLPSVLHWLVYTYCQVCLIFLQEALLCSGHLGCRLGTASVFQWPFFLIYSRRDCQCSALFGVLHLACSILMDMPSVDSGESLRWRFCPALEFCTGCVEYICSFFFLCPYRECRVLVFEVALVGARATLPFSRGA